jgi:lysozyme family protein
MKSIAEIIEDILTKEGGFANHPEDEPVNFGIGLRYARGLGLLFDKDQDGDVDERDILLVTKADARGRYFRDFYEGPMIDRLPEPLQPQLVDWAVNAGPYTAIQGLQRTLNRRFGYDLMEDGRYGPKTGKAAKGACSEYGWERVNNDLVDCRKAFYNALVQQRPKKRVFLNGWLTRAESFRVAV